MKLNIFSDLRKPGLVPGKSLSLAQNYVFCFGETLIYIMSNRKRNLHIHFNTEYDKVLKSFADGRNMRGRWWTSPTIADLLSDV